MAKTMHNDVYDAALNYIKNNCDVIYACSAAPTNFTEASATYALADHVMASGDFTVGDGDTNGRKVAVAEQAAILIDATGTFTHVALCDTVTSKVLAVDALAASQALTTGGGNTVTIPTFDIEIADPT